MRDGYNRRYMRAHPKSEKGCNLADAERAGWRLVAYNGEGYPIFRETTFSWLKRIVLRRPAGSRE